MGLSNASSGINILQEELKIEKTTAEDRIVALGGNPNVGKSTVFNSLTGLNQHTGNWPGKTVTNAYGSYKYKGRNFILVDIPGTYSLMANSVDEEVARDFICFGEPHTTVIVVDATCLERNLNLVLQTLEITSNVILCVNLMDEAKRKNIHINLKKLSHELGIPVVGTSAVKAIGLSNLMEEIYNISYGRFKLSPMSIRYSEEIEKAISMIENKVRAINQSKLSSRWISLKLLDGDLNLINSIDKYLDFDLSKEKNIVKEVERAKNYLKSMGIDRDSIRDIIVTNLISISERISKKVVTIENNGYKSLDRKIDNLLTSKKFGIPIMVLLLMIVFWITIRGANIPSEILARGFSFIERNLSLFFQWLKAPAWIHDVLVLGIFRTLSWVVSVMLPPMAIFFPMFTLLEDLGYLPRVAFNLDNFFKKSYACGKQALTMCMGFGCNAAGVIGCRIIDSPRERIIAIITNSFVPCNGRFPIFIAVISTFFVNFIKGTFQSLVLALILTSVIVLGVFMTLLVSKILSMTILKGLASSFTLELPPYRKPQLGRIIVRSILDRTLFVLGRAVVVAIPAGLIIWLMANIYLGDSNILTYTANFLNPLAKLIGLDGYILLAFLLGFPANEIVIPILLMSYMATGSLIELNSLAELKGVLIANGWTWVTGLSVMLFSLMHWPCATTCLTIRKETQSLKWTLVSFIIPAVAGFSLCFLVVNLIRLFSLL
ncbi:MAG: ferrous iron transport protein B [Tissierellia bacterium]|nr:ferrous iron transport protein B [Tissierellia bacterium]